MGEYFSASFSANFGALGGSALERYFLVTMTNYLQMLCIKGMNTPKLNDIVWNAIGSINKQAI